MKSKLERQYNYQDFKMGVHKIYLTSYDNKNFDIEFYNGYLNRVEKIGSVKAETDLELNKKVMSLLFK